MKTKKLSKKLRLNKQTIVSLSDLEMVRVNGGLPPTITCGGICSGTPCKNCSDSEIRC